MRTVSLVVLAVLLVLPGRPAVAAAGSVKSRRSSGDRERREERTRCVRRNDADSGAVVGVWVPGKGEFAQGIGYSNLSPRTPMALGDKFRIGSNTKTFVAPYCCSSWTRRS